MAELYQVNIKTFMKDIEPITETLKKEGYTDNRKSFTIKQVSIIIEFLGTPE